MSLLTQTKHHQFISKDDPGLMPLYEQYAHLLRFITEDWMPFPAIPELEDLLYVIGVEKVRTGDRWLVRQIY